MGAETTSILLGTLGLTITAVASLLLAISRSRVDARYLVRVRAVAGAGMILQGIHFGEEYQNQFYVHFPEVFGLAPWSERFFVTFNIAWLTALGLSIASVSKLPRISAFALWFLAIASTANGVVHPLLSLAVGGYFPGLWSSPLVGILGIMLLIALRSATGPQGAIHGAT